MNKVQKQIRVTTWKIKPASEISSPVLTSSWVEATHERAPPTAWRTREMRSEGMKIQ
jgi:hypothetical protein